MLVGISSQFWLCFTERDSRAVEANEGRGGEGGIALHFCRGNVLCLF